MIDLVPDLVVDAGVITDVEKLAKGGRQVSGVASDGVTIVLLRMPANFPGETLQVTLFNDRDGASTSVDQDGGLSDIQTTESGSPTPFGAFRFSSDPLTIHGVRT
jgi:hypothetical protein